MNEMSPAEQIEFISNVKTLATNGTLTELLRRIEDDQVQAWKASSEMSDREECWHILQGITLLRAKIESLNSEDKVRSWHNQRATRRL